MKGALVPVMLCLALVLGGCSTTNVKTTAVTPLDYGDPNLPENQLLDVGIHLFDPNAAEIDEDDLTVYPEVRAAEARYLPYRLMDTMQATGHWGAIRIIPHNSNTVDIFVDGKILRSDGEVLDLEIKVADATGKQWFERRYKAEASKYSYQAGRNQQAEPFQDVYNRIANDIAEYRQKLSAEEIANVRRVAELRFAESFSPEAFGGYLEQNRRGIYQVKRLPADNDPMLERIQRIRQRDYLFVDTLQDYYGEFVREMEDPYRDWRRKSYEEVIAYRELRNSTYLNAAAGAAAIIGGILAAGSDSATARAAGGVAILGGGYMVKSAMDRHAESQIHAEALRELGASMSAEITPQVIQLEDRTVTLSGTAEGQYEQWRNILRDMYSSEVGDISIGNSES